MSSEEARREVQDLIWENYYTLSTTAVQAMAIIWEEYSNGELVKWVTEEQGLTEGDLILILAHLTMWVGSLPQTDRHKPAMEVLASR